MKRRSVLQSNLAKESEALVEGRGSWVLSKLSWKLGGGGGGFCGGKSGASSFFFFFSSFGVCSLDCYGVGVFFCGGFSALLYADS